MKPELEQPDNSYGGLIIKAKGYRPDWLASLSDRAAWSLVRDGYNSVSDLRQAVEAGLQVSQIPNLGRAEVEEVTALISAEHLIALGQGEAGGWLVPVRWFLTPAGEKVGCCQVGARHPEHQPGEYWIWPNGDIINDPQLLDQISSWSN